MCPAAVDLLSTLSSFGLKAVSEVFATEVYRQANHRLINICLISGYRRETFLNEKERNKMETTLPTGINPAAFERISHRAHPQ